MRGLGNLVHLLAEIMVLIHSLCSSGKDEEISISVLLILPPVLLSTSLHLNAIDTIIFFSLQMRYQNSERLSDLPEVTQLVSGRWSQDLRLHPCFNSTTRTQSLHFYPCCYLSWPCCFNHHCHFLCEFRTRWVCLYSDFGCRAHKL